MKTTYDDSRLSPFVLTATDLQKTYEAIKQYVPEPQIEAECADRLKRRFSLLELLQFENPPSKDILSLHIFSYSPGGTILSLRLNRKAYLNYSLHIQGEEKEVIELREIISDRLSARRPWCAFIAGEKIGWIISILFAVLV